MDLEEEDESRGGDWISRRRLDLEEEDNEVARAMASANAAPVAADERHGERPRPPTAEWLERPKKNVLGTLPAVERRHACALAQDDASPRNSAVLAQDDASPRNSAVLPSYSIATGDGAGSEWDHSDSDEDLPILGPITQQAPHRLPLRVVAPVPLLQTDHGTAGGAGVKAGVKAGEKAPSASEAAMAAMAGAMRGANKGLARAPSKSVLGTALASRRASVMDSSMGSSITASAAAEKVAAAAEKAAANAAKFAAAFPPPAEAGTMAARVDVPPMAARHADRASPPPSSQEKWASAKADWRIGMDGSSCPSERPVGRSLAVGARVATGAWGAEADEGRREVPWLSTALDKTALSTAPIAARRSLWPRGASTWAAAQEEFSAVGPLSRPTSARSDIGDVRDATSNVLSPSRPMSSANAFSPRYGRRASGELLTSPAGGRAEQSPDEISSRTSLQSAEEVLRRLEGRKTRAKGAR